MSKWLWFRRARFGTFRHHRYITAPSPSSLTEVFEALDDVLLDDPARLRSQILLDIGADRVRHVQERLVEDRLLHRHVQRPELLWDGELRQSGGEV